MKVARNILKGMLIIIAVPFAFYAIELVAFPKKAIDFSLNQEKYGNTEVLDVNYKLRANKYATGKNEDLGGWYVSKNTPQKVEGEFTDKKLFLKLDENQHTLVEDKFIANKLFLVNNSDESVCFPAQDSRLYIKMQAKTIFGTWSDIDYIPNSWCGNSYHEVCLDKGEYWEFPSLQFKGRHKTKFRYKLENGEDHVFSNEINGFVNNGQFINKQEYFPTSLMDPYNE